ncbi:acetyl-CoA synthetase [Desulfobaculum xiamenense]|uniref:Acetyl-CoA synthetase n=1 Tax=Desulfobaculum xiamenense TaxID=995050 RepID=A0A846QLI1_9BACT|nr:AMP-binding protein [Desulfobaculum xiamenense]NJB69028.1 acetyl-CoA synthetase [Desulfobaculum xiamenense]
MTKLTARSYDEFLKSFRLEVPEHFNFAYDVLDTIAKDDPRRKAIIHVGPDGVRREYDFDWLARSSARLANALAERGVRKGDRIMLILFRRIEFWVTMMALHRLGAVAIPSPHLLTVKDIAYRVQAGHVRGCICEDSVAHTVHEAREQCSDFDLLIQCGPGQMLPGWQHFDHICATAADSFPRPADYAGGNDPLLIFFSSGTTGNPKMVEHRHTYAIGHYITGTYWHNLEPGDVHLTVADTGWGKAVWGKMYGQWMAGATVFVYDFRGKFDPAALLSVMAHEGVTTFCAPPTVYRFLIRQDLSKYDLSKLRYCTTAGELLNTSVFDDWKKATGLSIREGYGQTETTLQIATFSFMEPKPGSIGKPVPGWDIVLLDHDGNPCSTGEEGEICVRLRDDAPVIGLFNEYVDEPEKTAAAKCNGFYHTGDKAWMDEDGYFWFLGRVDDLIKSSGYRIGPFEVESALISHPAVVEAAVTGVPDPVRGQAVKATIVLSHDVEGTPELAKELQNHVKKVTAPYKYPRIIEFVDELPKTISGKIKRAEIRKRDLQAAD